MAQLQSTSITGSLIVTQGITGSFSGSATNAISASYAATASYALNAGDSIWTGSAGNIYYNGGNVGIGTASPAIPRGSGFRPMLHVYNNSSGTNPAVVVSAEDNQMAGYIAGDNAGGSDIGWGWNAYYQGSGNNFYNIRIGDNGTWTDRFTIDRYGNVGIGTTSPGATLQVNGTTKLGGGTFQVSSDQTFATNYSYTFRDAVGINNPNSLSAASATTVMSIGSMTNGVSLVTTGYIGVGTTNPTYQLDVNGNGRFTTTVSATKGIFSDSSGAGAVLEAYNTVATNATTAIIRQTTAGGNGNQDIGLLVDIQGAADTDRIANFRYYDGSTYTSRMAITRGGNVGIGTTNPLGTLEVTSAGASRGVVITSTGLLYQKYTSDALYIQSQASAGNTILNPTSGNVGIGTTSPLATLQITGLAANSGSSSANNPSGTLLLATDSGFNAQSYGSSLVFSQRWFSGLSNQVAVGQITGVKIGGDGTFGGGLAFWTSNTTTNSLVERVRITDNGNVGIGITNPTDKLTVEGNISIFSSYKIYNGSAADSAGISFPSNVVRIDGFSGITFNSSTTNIGSQTERMRITNDGNVGIGTTSPSRKFVVTTAANDEWIATFTNTGTGPYGVYIDTANNSGTAYSFATYTNAGTGFFVRNNGSVGIGTTSPTAKFEVNNNGLTGNPFYVDLGNTAGSTTLFEHTGASTPVPFRLRKSGFSGAAANYGLLYLSMNDGTVGNGSNLYFTLNDSVGNEHEYAGLGGVIRSNTNGSEQGDLVLMTSDNGTTRSEKMRIVSNGNVGIGITNPSSRLSLGLGIGPKFLLFDNSSTGVYSGLGQDLAAGNSTDLFAHGASNLGFLTFGKLGTDKTTYTEWMRITPAGNVGIGSTSPGAKLNIVESTSGYDQVAIFTGTGQYGSSIHLNATGTAGSNWRILSTANGSTPGGGHFGLYNDAAGLYRLVINPSGNVGIGTTSPTQKLEVNGNTWVSGTVYINRGVNSTEGYTYFDHPGTQVWKQGIFSDNTSTFSIGNGGGFTRLFNITNAGNVGIGTTSPASRLEVGNFLDAFTNSITVSGRYEYVPQFTFRLGQSGTNLDWTGGVISCGDDGNYNGIIYFKTANAGRDTPTTKMVIKANGNVGIGTTNPAFPLHVVRSSGDSVIVVDSGAAYNSQFRFQEAGTLTAAITFVSSDDSLRFYNGGDRFTILSNGNVGIGTTSPTQALTIQKSGYPIIDFYDGATGRGDIGYNTGTTSFNVSAYSSTPMAFYSNGLERMRITSAGNVGIGITNPGHKLHVVGAVGIGQNTNGTATIDAYGGNAYYGCDGTQITVTGNSGNVGIGTTSPSVKLDVAGNIKSSNVIYWNGTTGALSWDTGVVTMETNTATAIALKTNGTNRVYITSGGNVGIGVTNPGNLVTVGGNMRLVTGTLDGLFAYDAATGGAFIWSITRYTDINANDININARSGFAIRTGVESLTNSGHQFYVTSGGNVGIGVTAPAAKLQVSGSSNVLNVRGSGSVATSSIFSVDGNNGRLFEVSDDLSNSLFSVNTIAGLPVIEAFADYTVTMGTYGAYTLQVTGSRVGVGTSSPGYPLHVSGSVSGISIYATNDIAAFSDQSVKTDLQVIDSAVDRIKQINGYTYVRVDDLSNTRRAGVIAQEVQKVLPEVVSKNQDGTLNVAYSNMIALLIEGMKEQQSQIDKLREDLEDLRYEL